MHMHMYVHSTLLVSEIRELNQNKKKKKWAIHLSWAHNFPNF